MSKSADDGEIRPDSWFNLPAAARKLCVTPRYLREELINKGLLDVAWLNRRKTAGLISASLVIQLAEQILSNPDSFYLGESACDAETNESDAPPTKRPSRSKRSD